MNDIDKKSYQSGYNQCLIDIMLGMKLPNIAKNGYLVSRNGIYETIIQADFRIDIAMELDGVIYAKSGENVYKSTNNGYTWEVMK